MGNIFATAREVWVWLGRLTVPDCALSFKDVFDLSTVTGVKDWDLHTRARVRLQELRDLGGETWVHLLAKVCNHDYWSRLWVTQEFLKARSLTIFIGDESIHGEHLWAFINCIKKSMYTYPYGRVIQLVRKSGAHALWHSRLLWNEERGRSDETNNHRKLTTVLMTHILKRCSDWHDKIYGVLSLVDYGDAFPVDYRKEGIELLMDVIQTEVNNAWPVQWLIGFVLKILLNVPDSAFDTYHDLAPSRGITSMRWKMIPLSRYAVVNDSLNDGSSSFMVTEEGAAANARLGNEKIQICRCWDCTTQSTSPNVNPQPGDEIYMLGAVQLTSDHVFLTYLVLRPSKNSGSTHDYVGVMTRQIWQDWQIYFHCLPNFPSQYKLEHHLHRPSEPESPPYLELNPPTLNFLIRNFAVVSVEDGDYYTIRYNFIWDHDIPNSYEPTSRLWRETLSQAASQDIVGEFVHDDAGAVLRGITKIFNFKFL